LEIKWRLCREVLATQFWGRGEHHFISILNASTFNGGWGGKKTVMGIGKDITGDMWQFAD
jgi:hypothetical protein